MNIIFLITKPLACYRDKLLAALSNGGPYTDDHIHVVCSIYEKEYNIETFEKLKELCDNVTMFASSLAPYDKDKRCLGDYTNEVVGFNMWRMKLQGETCFVPPGWVPAISKWNKDGKMDFRQAATSFYGKLEGEDEEQHIVGPFFCQGDFFTSNPCVRGYNKKQGFMYRARNYVNRSVTAMDADYFVKCCESGHCDDSVELAKEPIAEEHVVAEEPKIEAPKKKSAKKKAAKRKTKRAKKKVAKKKSIKESLKEIRAEKENTPE